jgi:hypothetical protein
MNKREMRSVTLHVEDLRPYDVVIVGGGTAGLPSAIAASKQKAKTLLIEDTGSVGGLLISGLPLQGFEDENGRPLTGGIFREFLTRLTEVGGSTGAIPHETEHRVLASVDPPTARCVAFQMLSESTVKPLLHTRLIAAIRNGSTIQEIIVAGKSGLQSVRAKIFIDATGDGDLAAMAGVPFEKGRPKDGLTQSPALLFRLGGVNMEKVRDYFKHHPEEYLYAALLREGYSLNEHFLEKALLFSGFSKQIAEGRKRAVYGSGKDSLLFCVLPRSGQVLMNTIILLGLDATDSTSLTKGEVEASAEILPLIDFIRSWIPGFEQSFLIEVEKGLSIRESRRIVGEHVLTREDIQGSREFDDGVAIGSHFIDIHPVADNTWQTIRIRGTYEIPYRCLIAKGVENLLVAGRCISASHEAFASLRVMNTCCALGEAAGTAAGLAVRQNLLPRQLDGKRLKKMLLEPLRGDLKT